MGELSTIVRLEHTHSLLKQYINIIHVTLINSRQSLLNSVQQGCQTHMSNLGLD